MTADQQFPQVAGNPARDSIELERRKALAGSWRLIRIATHNQDGHVVENANRERGRGDAPAGMVTYTLGGHMAVQIVPTGRPLYSHGRPTADEALSLLAGMTSYFGTYTLDAMGTYVLHHLEWHTNPNLIGTDYKRFYTLENNILTLKLPARPNGPNLLTQSLDWVKLI